jgi:hypothetical protein
MLIIASRMMYSEKNEFELKEIYVSSGAETYILKKSEGYMPTECALSVPNQYETQEGQLFSNLGFSSPRFYNDKDAKSLANYFYDKIRAVNMSAPNAEKTLFDVLSSFGEM